jgi:hypothetical protein
MNDFWNLSDGDDVKETAGSGEFDAGGGNLLPIPAETSVMAAIDEAKWDKDQDGNRFISLRWTVLAPEDYKNRKVYQKLWVTDADPRTKADKVAAKRDKAKKMLGAIDTNCGGKLLAKGVEPTDESLTACLTNKPMVVKVMIWKMRDRQTDEMMRGNWVGAVAPKSAPQSSADDVAKAQAELEREVAREKTMGGGGGGGSRSMDDEIPF